MQDTLTCLSHSGERIPQLWLMLVWQTIWLLLVIVPFIGSMLDMTWHNMTWHGMIQRKADHYMPVAGVGLEGRELELDTIKSIECCCVIVQDPLAPTGSAEEGGVVNDACQWQARAGERWWCMAHWPVHLYCVTSPSLAELLILHTALMWAPGIGSFTGFNARSHQYQYLAAMLPAYTIKQDTLV